MILLMWVLVCLAFRRVEAYIETVVVSGCESCKIHLTCRHFSSIIAILEADFVQAFNETESNETITSTAFPPYHPRQALNRRCSGINYCSFILTEDCPGADSWGAGTLTVKYVCVSGVFPEDHIRKYCNTEIVLPSGTNPDIFQGFIHNPGYPRFYSSKRECRWRIRAQQEQKIKITVLDIAVTADRTSSPHECTDQLEFIDSGQLVQTTCEPQDPPLEVISEADSMELVLASNHALVPLRGMLIHYTAVGCPTPEPPEDGFLIFRNETSAEYRCCIDRVFADSGAKSKTINCVGASWDVDLPLANCTKKQINYSSSLPTDIRKLSKTEMASEILAPALIIAALFLINFFVLFYIYKIKQKQKIEIADEELGTLRAAERKRTSP